MPEPVPGMKRDCRCLRSRHQHGQRQAYLYDGCRCFACRLGASKTLTTRDWRDSGLFVARVAVVRRIEALHRVGWSEAELAARLGVTKQAVGDLRRRAGKHVLGSTAARVAAVYDELWDQTPPPARFRWRTLRWAEKQGFLPPMAWDDDTIDAPNGLPNTTSPGMVALDPVVVRNAVKEGIVASMNEAEHRAAVEILARQGMSSLEIGRLLGRSTEAVARMRVRHGMSSAA